MAQIQPRYVAALPNGFYRFEGGNPSMGASFSNVMDFGDGMYLSAYVTPRPTTMTPAKNYVLDCIDNSYPDGSRGRISLHYAVPTQDFVLTMTADGLPPYVFNFSCTYCTTTVILRRLLEKYLREIHTSTHLV